MATETFSILGPPHSFCTCGKPSCRGECNLPPVEDVSDLVDAGVWEERERAAEAEAVRRPTRMRSKKAPLHAEGVVEDAADLFAAGVWDHKLM